MDGNFNDGYANEFDTSAGGAATLATRGVRLGEILVKQGLLTRDEVKQILQIQKRQGRPFGVLAEQLFGLDPRCVESAWVKQYAALAGIVEIDGVEIDETCVELINRRQAWQFHLAVVRREEGELVLISDEKHLAKALRFAAATFEEPTFFQVAETAALEELLMELYPVPTFIADFATRR